MIVISDKANSKVIISEEVNRELSQLVMTTLKTKFPNIDETTLTDIMTTQRDIYIDFLNERYNTVEQWNNEKTILW
jgi:hypothetical protein